MENKKILLIDDDVDITRSFQVILESENYSVRAANNAEDGMEMFKSDKPDLLILDIMMASDLEGYNLAHKIKKEPDNIDMPILIISGMQENIGVNFASAIEDYEALPGVSFLHKPVEHEELLREVKTLIK
jgi:CheY-like chemotaxis protein